jgi:transcription elongation factor GreA-like protein
MKFKKITLETINIFYQTLLCKNIRRKQSKNIKKSWKNILEFFAKDFDTQEVQEARFRGATSRK